MIEKTLTIPESILKAENMSYDNSNSGLNATDTQAAIDEIQNQTLNALYFDETLEISGPVATPLTTQHIVDNVESDASNKVLSAKQGKVLNARISNIIANNNDTDGNDELVDMRVDVDGVPHDSAGDAVRSQVSKLSSEIAEIETDIENMFESSVNLFNKSEITKDMAISGLGNISTDNAVGIYCVSDPIKVKPNTTYTKNNNEYAMYLDSNLTKININTSPWEVLQTPSNCAYVRVNVRYANLDDFMLVEGTELPSKYVPFQKYIKAELLNSDTSYMGKKIVTFGDSLVYGGGWQDYVAKVTGATVLNMGIGGTTMTNRDSQWWLDENGQYIADDTEPQPSGTTLCWDSISGYPIGADNTNDRIGLIPNDTDIVFVEFGTNDLHQSKPIGAWSDTDNNSFKGAMKLCAERIREKLPLAKVIFMTPTVERTDFVNDLGLHKIDYIKAILEAEIEINVPVINLWAKTSWSISTYPNYSVDAVHWNDLGKQIVGSIVSGYLMSEEIVTL